MIRAALRSAAAASLLDALPSAGAAACVRRRALPALAGLGAPDHVALTIDDGPDPESTERLLDVLADQHACATFFLLGAAARRYPALAKTVSTAGHEVAVHGDDHRPHLLRTPPGIVADLRRARRTIAEVTEQAPQWWRPPHGVATATGLLAARSLGLRPVLWTADGADWRPGSTAASITARLHSQLAGGGVVLLHDAPGSRGRSVAEALDSLVGWCREQGWRIGPLAEHWTAPRRSASCT
jgi:peptidoglycan/xylan/chitin deacetylase (PgdA/CDA1 family)